MKRSTTRLQPRLPERLENRLLFGSVLDKARHIQQRTTADTFLLSRLSRHISSHSRKAMFVGMLFMNSSSIE
jgi:hypothetical protein